MPIDSFKKGDRDRQVEPWGETDEGRRLAMGVWDEQARMSPEKQFWAS